MSVLNGLILLALWAAEQWIGERHWLTTGLAYMPQQAILLPGALLLLFALADRDGRSLRVLAVTAIFTLFTFLGFRWHLGAAPPGVPLRVMTYNIHHASDGPDNVARVIRSARPDVVCLQEANAMSGVPDPVPLLERALPEYDFVRHEELAIASRVPIREWRHAPTMGRRRPALVAVMEREGIRFRVINVHFATAGGAVSLAEAGRDRPAYLRDTARVRVRQAEGVAALVEGKTEPIVLCGDFNTPPRGRVYRRLAGLFADAWSESGRGFGYTYHSGVPLLRIDYVWTRNGARAWRTRVPAVKASDHRPVVADVRLPRSSE